MKTRVGGQKMKPGKRLKVTRREQRALLSAQVRTERAGEFEAQRARIELLEELLGLRAGEPPTEFQRGQLPVGTGDEEVWLNNRWQVNVRRFAGWGIFEGQRITHLSIKRLDKLAIHDWRDLQWIKNKLAGAECEAFELYPMESRLVDGSNQFHLWCIEGILPVGFSERCATERPLRMILPDGSVTESVQRPFAEHVRPADLAECEAAQEKRLRELERSEELRQSFRKPADR